MIVNLKYFKRFYKNNFKIFAYDSLFNFIDPKPEEWKNIEGIYFDFFDYRVVNRVNNNYKFINIFDFICLKCKKVFLNKNIIIEHSFRHIDKLVFINKDYIKELNNCNKNCDRKNIVIMEFLNNSYMPILLKSFNEIFDFEMNLNYYYIINSDMDLIKLNACKRFVFRNSEYLKYSENFYLIKIEFSYYKNTKKFWVISLYGYNYELNKFKFLFFFEIYYQKSNILNKYRKRYFKKLDVFISYIYVSSIYNRYYWTNLTSRLQDDDEIFFKNELKEGKTKFYEDWLRKQNKFYGINKVLRKKWDIERVYKYIKYEKSLRISKWVLRKEWELKRKLFNINEELIKENNLRYNYKLRKNNEKIKNYFFYSNIIFELEDWFILNKLNYSNKNFINDIKFDLKLFFSKFNFDGTMKKIIKKN